MRLTSENVLVHVCLTRQPGPGQNDNQNPRNHSPRFRRLRNMVCGQWLVARTLATVLLMIVARQLHLPGPSSG